jgi:hypothetical protein
MIPLLIVSVLLLLAIMLFMKQWSANRMPGKKQRDRAVAELKADMNRWSADLVPLNKADLDLFSLTQDKQVIKSGTGATAKGTFTTIFHEPVVSYSYRRYLGSKTNELLYARTAEHDYVYWTENGKTSLEIDGQPVGNMEGNALFGQKTGKELARIALLPARITCPSASVAGRLVLSSSNHSAATTRSASEPSSSSPMTSTTRKSSCS